MPTSFFNPKNAKAIPGPAHAGSALSPSPSPYLSYGIRDVPAPLVAAGAPEDLAALTAPAASATTDGIDGSSDWYYKGPNVSCPKIAAPSKAPTASRTGILVTTTWQNVGTDVWYYAWVCDETEHNCTTVGTTPPWYPAWPTGDGPLWPEVAYGFIDPIDATGGSGATKNHKFAIYVKSFGAGNTKVGGNSGEVSITVP